MKAKLKFTIILLLILAGNNIANAQQAPMQLAPANGATGINGPVSGSYIMTWSSVPNAISYQWVNSNNHLCFYGCAGDTRTGITNDTSVIIYYISDNEWRYWIVRAFLSNGDTTDAYLIFSFLPKKDSTEAPLFSISPNPAKDFITISLDWYSNSTLNKLSYTVIDFNGRTIAINKEITLVKNQFIRNEKHTLELSPLSPGIYFVIITLDTNFLQYIEKAIIY